MFIQKFILFYLIAVANAYTLEAFPEKGCNGTAQIVNVWDSTCATWHEPFNSYRAKYYGARQQRGTFYGSHSCALTAKESVEFWADGDGEYFQKGECWDTKHTVYASGSRIA